MSQVCSNSQHFVFIVTGVAKASIRLSTIPNVEQCSLTFGLPGGKQDCTSFDTLNRNVRLSLTTATFVR